MCALCACAYVSLLQEKGAARRRRGGRTFLGDGVGKVQDLLRLGEHPLVLHLLRRRREKDWDDVGQCEGAEDEERVEEADVLVRDTTWPEKREQARVSALCGIGEQHRGKLGRGSWRGRRVEDEQHFVHADENENNITPLSSS